jgi:hypothetical protein
VNPPGAASNSSAATLNSALVGYMRFSVMYCVREGEEITLIWSAQVRMRQQSLSFSVSVSRVLAFFHEKPGMMGDG